ncbi:hypothetical protein BGZ98_000163 [Dissophora globulifera]|nr:hypothetical protein BGZ98_000163 [Dissophora globulifera]
MLALQSTPLHLRDQDKQDRRFDQPLLFSGFHPSSLHHHHHHAHSASASHNHHHPRHHSYHHPIPACLTTASALSAVLMPTATQFNQKAFFLDCDLKQDLSIATGSRIMHHSSNSTAAKNGNITNGSHLAPVATAAAAVPCPPRIQNCPNMDEPTQQTPIHKIQARISRMTLEDCAKEKIVLLLTDALA